MVGGGAREHTLVWKLAESPKVKEIYAAPGNAGTARLAQNLDIKSEDIGALLKFARDNRVELTVVGPEAPLAAGIVDLFLANRLHIFGASQAATEIESSKVFAKELMQRHGIPCAASASFADFAQAREYVQRQKPPVVIKADGLAAGKGVIIAESIEDAEKALSSMMEGRSFGAAGEKVVIEEYLHGREVSFFVFTDGRTVVPTVPACDYKRIHDGNRGPNTGGMGSFSPPPFFNPALGHIIGQTIMEPTVLALADEGRSYKGVLYGGLMITNHVPKVIEFNARFGDPEAQVVLPRLRTDLVDIMLAVIDGRLEQMNIEWSEEACVGVVMASGGYPGTYRTGFPVSGLEDVDAEVMVFHAGTRVSPEGQIMTAGGRVLTVAATGRDLAEAREKVYRNISRIRFEGCQYRKDIADIK
ncbi:MAG TPA: phosphoribosylamine--glycine ligase [Dehalococcoidales bacterium]|nr:phosphoribosylamine--glycine ligase [Dehalococcoidales bacterium]